LPYPQYHHVCYQLSFASSACTANPYAIDCIIDGMLLTLISSCTSWNQIKSTNPLLLLLPITSTAMSIAISTHGYSFPGMLDRLLFWLFLPSWFLRAVSNGET